MKIRPFLPTAVASAVLAIAAPASGAAPESGPSSQFRLDVSGQVAVVCRVSIDTAVIPDVAGRVSLGTMKEFCNNPSGYRVVVDHPAIAGPAMLIVDGREIALNSGAAVVISQSAGAAVAARKVELEVAQGGQSGTLAFRIEPLR